LTPSAATGKPLSQLGVIMTQSASERVTMIRPPGEESFTYQVIRYTPNLVRDECANIGIFVLMK
jgi:hypothetical protein